MRATCLRALGIARNVRYHISHEKDDLDKSVLHFVEANLLPYPPSEISSEDIANSYFYLTSARRWRSEEYEQLEDVTVSDVNQLVEYFRHLRRLPIDAFAQQSIVVTGPGLAPQVEVEAEIRCEIWKRGSHRVLSGGVQDMPTWTRSVHGAGQLSRHLLPLIR